MIRTNIVKSICRLKLTLLAQLVLCAVTMVTASAENQSARSTPASLELWEFTAPWCVHCENMTPVVRKLAKQGVPVRQIPIDEYRSLAEQAEVTRLPCFLLVSNGQIIDRKVGLSSEGDLLALYKKHLLHNGIARAKPTNPTIIRGQQAAPRPFSRLGSAITSLADRLSPPPAPFAAIESPLLSASTAPIASIPRTPTTVATAIDLVKTDTEDPVTKALNATVLLRIEDPQGVSLGTGTIVDIHENEALVLTCGHIFRDSEGKGAITCDLQGQHSRKDVPGQLISYDLKRDIGLVSLRAGQNIQPIQIAGPGYQAREREGVFAIGCSQGAAATVIRNQIIAVNRYNGPANLVVGGRPINGRSGGGLFSQSGRLIGVCNAADTEEDEGLYAALGPIQAELDDAGLDFVYRRASPTNRPFTGLAAAEVNPPSSDSIRPSEGPVSDAEVICIVRPKASGDDAGKAYVLDKPSAELLSQLSKELSKRGAHQFTGSQQPRVRPHSVESQLP